METEKVFFFFKNAKQFFDLKIYFISLIAFYVTCFKAM